MLSRVPEIYGKLWNSVYVSVVDLIAQRLVASPDNVERYLTIAFASGVSECFAEQNARLAQFQELRRYDHRASTWPVKLHSSCTRSEHPRTVQGAVAGLDRPQHG